jgi:hypothetical protein
MLSHVANGSLQLEVELLQAGSADARIVEQHTLDLAHELRGVRGVRIERTYARAPADAKGLDVAAIGSLLVSLGGAVGAVTALVGVLRGWVTREEGRKIRVRIDDRELELSGASRDEEQQLIDAFVRSVDRG